MRALGGQLPWHPLTIAGLGLLWPQPQGLEPGSPSLAGKMGVFCAGAGQKWGAGPGLLITDHVQELLSLTTWFWGLLLQLPVDCTHLFCQKWHTAGTLLDARQCKR